MPYTLPEVMPHTEIAPILGIQPRAVLIRAKKEGWHTIPKRVRGGYRYDVLIRQSPDYLKEAIAANALPECGPLEGLQHGLRINRERAEAKELRRRAKENGLALYQALPPERQAECDAKYEILQMRDAFIHMANLPLKRGSQQFTAEVKADRIKLAQWIRDPLPQRKGQIALSWSSLNRWQQAYDEYGLAGLASGHIATKTTSVPEHMQKVIIGMIVEYPHATNKKFVMGLQARFDGQVIPSSSAIRRFVKAWKKKHAGLMLFLTNPDKWRSKHQFAVGNASEDVVRLNQRWEMDSTPADVMLLDGRYTVIGLIDVYSRRLRLLISPTSKATAVAALIRRGIVDWGIPENIRTDNGKDYVSKHIVRVLDGLEVDHEICDPFKPEQKPHIERAFKTFSHDLVELMPEFIGHNVAEQQARRARQSFAKRMMTRSAEVELRMTAVQFQEFCDRWLNAHYHQNPHAGLKGKTPAEFTRHWTEPIDEIKSERALDMLLCPAPRDGGIRTIGKKCIWVDKIDYSAPEMAGKEGEKVRHDELSAFITRNNTWERRHALPDPKQRQLFGSHWNTA